MRSDWDTYFIKLAHGAAERSTCPRRHVGAVLVRDKRVLGTGYNGAPSGDPHCDDVGCDMRDGSCVRTTHAEPNALAALSRTPRASSTLYCTDFPCRDCAGVVATSGVIEFVFDRDYIAHKLAQPGLDAYVEANLRAWESDVNDLFTYHGIVLRQHALVG